MKNTASSPKQGVRAMTETTKRRKQRGTFFLIGGVVTRLLQSAEYMKEQSYAPTANLMREAADLLEDCGSVLRLHAKGKNKAARLLRKIS